MKPVVTPRMPSPTMLFETLLICALSLCAALDPSKYATKTVDCRRDSDKYRALVERVDDIDMHLRLTVSPLEPAVVIPRCSDTYEHVGDMADLECPNDETDGATMVRFINSLVGYCTKAPRMMIIGGHPASTSVYEYTPASSEGKATTVGTLNEPIDKAIGAGMISDTEALIVNTGVGEQQGVIETHFLNINDFTLRDGPNRLLSTVTRDSAAFLHTSFVTVICGGSGGAEGENRDYLTSCEWLFGSEDTFEYFNDRNLNVPRMGAAMAGPFIKDGTYALIISGGWGRIDEPGSNAYLTGTLQTAEILKFSGSDGGWQMVSGTMRSGSRTDHAAAMLGNDMNEMIICGGFQGNFNYLKSCDIYNVENDYWMAGPELTTARMGLSMIELSGYLYAVAGLGEVASPSSVERLSIADEDRTWEQTDDVFSRSDGINLGNGPTIFGIY